MAEKNKAVTPVETVTPVEMVTKAKESEAFVYIGPALPNGQLKSNAVFRGSLAKVKKHLSGILKAYPMVERLIVPIGGLSEARKTNGIRGDQVRASAAARKKEG